MTYRITYPSGDGELHIDSEVKQTDVARYHTFTFTRAGNESGVEKLVATAKDILRMYADEVANIKNEKDAERIAKAG